MRLLPDLTPLQESAAYRGLWAGNALANLGSQLATVAIGLQVYDLTRSTAAVGIVGLCALVPLVVMGLYGGSLADHHDRRRLGLGAQTIALLASLLCATQALLGNRQVWVLYALVALWNGAFAVLSPARSSIVPRILPLHQLPAANALGFMTFNLAMFVGPLLAGVLVHGYGFQGAYLADVVVTSGALVGLWRLPPMPPDPHEEGHASRAGWRSVWDGFRFLRRSPNVRMTFVADIAAMVLAQPRVLLPAAGAVILGGGAQTVGALYAAAAAGGIVTMGLSGPLGAVRRQGLAVMVSILGWAVGVATLGLGLLSAGAALERTTAFWLSCLGMAVAGGADSVSAVFRSTILQVAAPDRMRGRLQGVFIVVVAGGPRLGELFGGAVAVRIGEGWTALAGGIACVVAIAALSLVQPGFIRYDARCPRP